MLGLRDSAWISSPVGLRFPPIVTPASSDARRAALAARNTEPFVISSNGRIGKNPVQLMSMLTRHQRSRATSARPARSTSFAMSAGVERELGVRFRPFDETARDVVAWYRAAGEAGRRARGDDGRPLAGAGTLGTSLKTFSLVIAVVDCAFVFGAQRRWGHAFVASTFVVNSAGTAD